MVGGYRVIWIFSSGSSREEDIGRRLGSLQEVLIRQRFLGGRLGVYDQNMVDDLVEMGQIVLHGGGFLKKDTAVASRAYQLHNGEKHLLRMETLNLAFGHQFFKVLIELHAFFRHRCIDGILEDTPGKILADKLKQALVMLQNIYDVIKDKEKLVFKTIHRVLHEGLVGPEKKLAGLVGDQLVPQIIFILEIEVEGTLSQAGIFDNV